MGAGNDVELELQKLRGELGSGATPELEAGRRRLRRERGP